MFSIFKSFFSKNNHNKFLSIIVDILVIDIADEYLTKMKNDNGENIPEYVLSFLDKTVLMSERNIKIKKIKKFIKPLREEQEKSITNYLNMTQLEKFEDNKKDEKILDQEQEESVILNGEKKSEELQFNNEIFYQTLIIRFNSILNLIINEKIQKQLIEFLQENYLILEEAEAWSKKTKNIIFNFLIAQNELTNKLLELDI